MRRKLGGKSGAELGTKLGKEMARQLVEGLLEGELVVGIRKERVNQSLARVVKGQKVRSEVWKLLAVTWCRRASRS